MEHVLALIFVFQLRTGVFFGTILAHTFLIFIFVVKICLIISLPIFISSAIILMLEHLYVLKASLSFPHFYQFSSLLDGHIIHQLPHPLFLLKTSCAIQTWALDKVFSPYTSHNKLNVSMAVLFSFTRNFMLTCCSVFCQAWLQHIIKNHCWTLHQHNWAWFSTQLGEGSAVTNIYLLSDQWSK